MTQNTKAGLQVIALTCSALMIALAAVAVGHSKSQQRAKDLAVQHSLKSCWQNISAEKQFLKGSDVRSFFSPETNTNRQPPSFVAAEDVFYSQNPVSVRSKDLLCVIRSGKDFPGIRGNGECNLASKDEFKNWPKVAFK